MELLESHNQRQSSELRKQVQQLEHQIEGGRERSKTGAQSTEYFHYHSRDLPSIFLLYDFMVWKSGSEAYYLLDRSEAEIFQKNKSDNLQIISWETERN